MLACLPSRLAQTPRSAISCTQLSQRGASSGDAQPPCVVLIQPTDEAQRGQRASHDCHAHGGITPPVQHRLWVDAPAAPAQLLLQNSHLRQHQGQGLGPAGAREGVAAAQRIELP